MAASLPVWGVYAKDEEVRMIRRRRTVRQRSMATPPQQILASEADEERRAHSQGREYQTPQPSGSDVDRGGCLGAIKQFAGATEWKLGVAEMSKFQYKSAANSYPRRPHFRTMLLATNDH